MKTEDFENYFKKSVLSIEPYSCETPIDVLGRMHQNESYTDEEDSYQSQLYPSLQLLKIKEFYGDFFQIPTDHIEVTSGSTQALEMIAASLYRSTSKIAIPYPSFFAFENHAKIYESQIIPINLTYPFEYTRENLLNKDVLESDVAIICSPNTPSGNRIDLQLLQEFLDKYQGITVIDEAYGEFAEAQGDPSFIQKFGFLPRVIVTRTLSKAWALAGVRLGFLIAEPRMLQILRKVKPVYGVSLLSEKIGFELMKKRSVTLWSDIQKLYEMQLTMTSFLRDYGEVSNSCTHFLCFKTQNIEKIYLALRKENLWTRLFEHQKQKWMRLNVWDPKSNQAFQKIIFDHS